MDGLLTACVCCVVVLILYVLITSTQRPYNLPPGPRRWPIVGALPYIGKHSHISLTNMSKQYGDVLSIYFGEKLVIVLNTVDAMKEILLKNKLADRPDSAISRIFNKGILFTSGNVWKKHRKFSSKCLKSMPNMEEIILKELFFICEDIKRQQNMVIDLRSLVNKGFSNIVCSFIFGHRFEYEDERLIKLINIAEKSFKSSSLSALKDFIPFLPIRDSAEENWLALKEHLNSIIQETRRDYSKGKTGNFIFEYLDYEDDSFTDDQLIGDARDIIMAGTDTGTGTILYAILFMILNPEIQGKVQDEIDKIVGKDRSVTMKDKKIMPYTEATIYEVQRLANIAPLGIPYVTNEDTSLYQYTIPKDAWIFTNLHAVHMDDRKWDKPDIFNPTRFLDNNGHVTVPEHFIPFGKGKRFCMGEFLATQELFLCFTTMIQKFTFCLSDPEHPPSTVPRIAITLAPQPYTVIARPR